jgi:hypothetical protein
MQLELGTGQIVKDPSLDQIAAALKALPGGDDSFAILSRDEMTYMQTTGSAAGGFELEYQAGSTREHYMCTNRQVSLDVTIRVFQLYAQRDVRWLSEVAWEPEPL